MHGEALPSFFASLSRMPGLRMGTLAGLLMGNSAGEQGGIMACISTELEGGVFGTKGSPALFPALLEADACPPQHGILRRA